MMRKFLYILVILLVAVAVRAQESDPVVGIWSGALEIQGVKLHLVFHVKVSDTTYKSTMDVIEQQAIGIHVTSTSFKESTLNFNIAQVGAKFDGKLRNDSIVGTFRQSGINFPLTLARVTQNRPQTPAKPYPYYTEDVEFANESANFKLGGTLVLPSQKGRFPVVVFITGSGAQNRDEEFYDHKPFLVIADYLARKGIASLRFDDRGVGQSGGTGAGATVADFATDVESAVDYLKSRKEIDKSKIGLIGHSEGGCVAALVASKCRNINCIVMLAGPGIRGAEGILLQKEHAYRSMGGQEKAIQQQLKEDRKQFNLVINAPDTQALKASLTAYADSILASYPAGMLSETDKQTQKKQLLALAEPWFVYTLKTDPADALRKVKCPVLAINGAKDIQVTPNENIAAIQKALTEGGNKDVTVRIFPDLNHIFQKCTTGLTSEYSFIDETISPEVLDFVSQWIIEHSK